MKSHSSLSRETLVRLFAFAGVSVVNSVTVARVANTLDTKIEIIIAG
jgi:hypothetical protein